jgi:Concanavalin A-like lectin/glucanases superfamily
MVASVSGLFVAGTVARHLTRSSTPSAAVSANRVAAAVDAATATRGGFNARPDLGAPGAPPGSEGSGGGGLAGAGRAIAGGRTAAGAPAESDRGAATVIGSGGTGAGGHGFGRLPGVHYTANGGIQVQSTAPEAALPFDNLHPQSGGNPAYANHLQQAANQLPPGSNAQSPDAPTDPNAPVLKLSFDGTTQPDAGPAPEVDKNITFDNGNGATFSTNSQLALPDLGGLDPQQGTIAMQIQPDWNGSDPGNASLIQAHSDNIWENRLQIFKNNQYLRFMITPDSGVEAGVGIDISNWQQGQQHAIAMSYGQDPVSGANTLSVYVDGQLAGTTNYDGNFNPPPNTPLFVGSDYTNGEPGANAVISNLQAYKSVLSAGRISSLFSPAG